MSRRRHPKRFTSGETFARLPTEVLQSEAYKALPDWAARVLIALAAQYQGKQNNGDLSLTKRQAAEYGVAPPWKLSAAINLLVVHTSLIERTRVGKIQDGKGIAALYGLGWLQIDPSPKYDVPTTMPHPAPHRWARWKRPDDWEAIVEKARRKAQGKESKNSVSPRVYQAGHPVCTEKDESRTPRVTQGMQSAGQPGVSPLEISAVSAHKPPLSGCPLERALAGLIVQLPHLLDTDVARTFNTDVMRVAAVRAKLAEGWKP